MRRSGTLRSWNDDRGFGFIAPSDGQADLFLHISELPRDGTRPTIGERVSYEIGRGRDGKPQAVNAVREALGDTRNIKRAPALKRTHGPQAGSKVLVVLLLIALGAYGYKHYAQRVAVYSNAAAISTVDEQPAIKQEPPAVRQEQALLQPAQPLVKQEVPAGRSQCDGRTHCSQMTSCAEAKYFLQNCPGVEMDGNHDGTPCEKQWCTSPFAK
jgi:cold shock CspA family protein